MTPAKFANYVRTMTRTSSTTFTDAEILALMEVRQLELAEEILKTDEDILLVPQYRNLVLNQRDYAYPNDIIARIKRVEAKLDGTNWIVLHEIDLGDIGTSIASEDDITRIFNNSQYEAGNPNGARFDIIRKQLYIFSGSITAVTAGLRLYCDTYPTPVTDLTSTADMSIDPSVTTHGIPIPLHRVWAKGVIIDYKTSRPKPIALTEGELKYEYDLQKAIATLKHGNLDREVIGDLPSPQEIGNNGFDY